MCSGFAGAHFCASRIRHYCLCVKKVFEKGDFNLEAKMNKNLKLSLGVLDLLDRLRAKDEYTFLHSVRVARYAEVISKEMGLSDEEVGRAYLSGLVHDLGKIYIPDSILLKAEVLTDREFVTMKSHPLLSENLCRKVKGLREVAPIVRAHHERVDGSGYPDGLNGESIPLIARVVAVADSLDAMTSNRPYQKKRTLEKAKLILDSEAGRQWDEDAVFAALQCIDEGQIRDALEEVSDTQVEVEYDLLSDTAFAV